MPSLPLAPLDLFAIVAYLGVIVWIGLRTVRRHESSEDYFLAGRSLKWPVIGLSLYATNVSSSTLVGLAGSAYSSGIAVFNYEWMAVVVLVFFVAFVLPLYVRNRLYTTPEYLERRYDYRARLYVSGLTLVSNVVIDLAGALYAGALVIQALVPGLPLLAATTGIALAAGIYTVAGGLRSVVQTDVIQAFLLTLGAGLISWGAYRAVGSWDAVTQAVPDAALHLIQPVSSTDVPWPGLVSGLVLLGLYYWCFNQTIVQRTLAARSVLDGRRGALLVGLLKLPVLALLVFPGLFARVLYPDLASADLVFPRLALDLLPVGLRGLVLTAFLAAIMSSLDSVINAASTLVTLDFLGRFRPGLSERAQVRVGRVTGTLLLVLSAFTAPQVARFTSLWEYLQTALAYTTPPLVALLLAGLFWRRASARGALAALATGLVSALVLLVVPLDLHFLYVAALLFGVSGVALVVGSLAGPSAPVPAALMWSPSDVLAASGAPWYARPGVQAAALLALTAAVVIAFW